MSETSGGPGDPEYIDLGGPNAIITTAAERDAAREAAGAAGLPDPDTFSAPADAPGLRGKMRAAEEKAGERWEKRPHTFEEHQASKEAAGEAARENWRQARAAAGEVASERVRVARANVETAGRAVGIVAAHIEAKAGERWDARRHAKAASRAEAEAAKREDEAYAINETIDQQAKASVPERADLKARVEKYAEELERETMLANSRGTKIASVEIDHPSEEMAQALSREFKMTEAEVWLKEADKMKPEVWTGPTHVFSLTKRAVLSAWERRRNLKTTDASRKNRSQRFLLAEDKKTVMELVYHGQPGGIVGRAKQGGEVLDSMRLIHAEDGAYDGEGKPTKEYGAFQKLDRPKSPVWLPRNEAAARQEGLYGVDSLSPLQGQAYKDQAYEARRLPTRITAPSNKPEMVVQPEQQATAGADNASTDTGEGIVPESDVNVAVVPDRIDTGGNTVLPPDASAGSAEDGEPDAIISGELMPDDLALGLGSGSDILDGEIIEDSARPELGGPSKMLELTQFPHESSGGRENNSADTIMPASPQNKVIYPKIERREQTLQREFSTRAGTEGASNRLGNRRATRPEGPVGVTAPEQFAESANPPEQAGPPERAGGAEAPPRVEYSIEPGNLAKGEVSEFSKTVNKIRDIDDRFGVAPTGQLPEAKVVRIVEAAESSAALNSVEREIIRRGKQEREFRRMFAGRGDADAGKPTGERADIQPQSEKQLLAKVRAQRGVLRERVRAENLRRKEAAMIDVDDAYDNDQGISRASSGIIQRGNRRGNSSQVGTSESMDDDVRQSAMRASERNRAMAAEAISTSRVEAPVTSVEVPGASVEVPGTSQPERSVSNIESGTYVPFQDEIAALRGVREKAEYVQTRDALVAEALSSGYVLPDAGASLGVRPGADPESAGFIHEMRDGRQLEATTEPRIRNAEHNYRAESDKYQTQGILEDIDRVGAATNQTASKKQREIERYIREAISKKLVKPDKNSDIGISSIGTDESGKFVSRVREISIPKPKSAGGSTATPIVAQQETGAEANSAEIETQPTENEPAPVAEATTSERATGRPEVGPGPDIAEEASELDEVVAKMAVKLEKIRVIQDVKGRRARVKTLAKEADKAGLATYSDGILRVVGASGSETRRLSEQFVEAMEDIQAKVKPTVDEGKESGEVKPTRAVRRVRQGERERASKEKKPE